MLGLPILTKLNLDADELGQRLQWLGFNDASSLHHARVCERSIIAVELGDCGRDQLEQLKQRLQLLQLKPIGIIIS
ncbi:hypothetical protein KBY79_12630 [Synechococcus lacustris C3-12m-Tous]|uniref:hypothetical protein n=1 Tax=Synechococcus lacustris TaxID=2116544 RepID=UPI0020CBFB8E|nr:hypothetical protein [Synechococcus lacustris]MCP9926051.1 hypothetical protein [Synechococcus lacustris C3-12m-Tous]